MIFINVHHVQAHITSNNSTLLCSTYPQVCAVPVVDSVLLKCVIKLLLKMLNTILVLTLVRLADHMCIVIIMCYYI